ncbi:MAG: cell division protein ZapA [Clostridium sp.]|nr:cell division protein ZapA [Clostridium sp.]
MDSKNYTDVLINGKIYTLGGAEEESYLQQVASYINEKMSGLQRQPGFQRQSDDYKSVMTFLNLADDYFKERQYAARLEHENQNLEKETYSLKHELVSTQMKLETLHRESEDLKRQLQELLLRVPDREKILTESEMEEKAEDLARTEAQVSLEG